ncbi:MAG TPA: DUF5683 domain-containing protein [Candidatus Eisenbacteria bacterium]|nr:DUF5683 domain-containing protein [Candidatus Eisenbacteria bacterium]
MGSIPTRSRHFAGRPQVPRTFSSSGAARLVLVSLAIAASLMVGSALAQTPSAPDDDDPKPNAAPPDTAGAIAPVPVTPPPESQPAPPDTTKRRASPFKVMLRSTVLPGWGQMYNGKPLKAAVIVAGEGYLVYKALDELSKENDAVDRMEQVPIDSPEWIAAQDDKEKHYNLKINYIWWAAVVHLLQMADAYVDAHLRDFNADLGPLPGPGLAHAASSGPDPGLAVALRVRF